MRLRDKLSGLLLGASFIVYKAHTLAHQGSKPSRVIPPPCILEKKAHEKFGDLEELRSIIDLNYPNLIPTPYRKKN